jgi:hypothetical protein
MGNDAGHGKIPSVSIESQETFKDTSPDGESLFRDAKAVSPLSPGIDISDLEPLCNVYAGTNEPSEYPVDQGPGRHTLHKADLFPFCDNVSDILLRVPGPPYRGPEDPVGSDAEDLPRHTRIWGG